MPDESAPSQDRLADELDGLRSRAYGPTSDLLPEEWERLAQLEDERMHPVVDAVSEPAGPPPVPASPTTPTDVPATKARRIVPILLGAIVVAAVSSAVTYVAATPAPVDESLRVVMPGATWIAGSEPAIIRCLDAAGRESEWDRTDAVITIRDEDAEASAVFAACVDEVSEANEARVLELSAAARYPAERRIAECLRSAGIDVPEIPDRDAFIESYVNETAWMAYNFVDVQVDELGAVLELCPPEMY